MTVKESFQKYLKKCTVKNLSEVSLKNYETKCNDFIQYVGAEADVLTITNELVEDYTLQLQGIETLNETSVVTQMKTVRAFLYYLMENNIINYFKVVIPKAEKKEKETYSNTDIIALLKEPGFDAKKKEIRAYTFVNFLIGTGVRLGTSINVKVSDIDFQAGMIHLDKLKSRKEYSIPLAAKLGEILTGYIEYFELSNDDYIFPNAYGKKASERTYQQLVQWYNESRNVECTSCHAFRHTFAKQYVLAGGDVFRLQKILSHANITTTKEYVDMFAEDLKVGFNQFNVLDKLSM